MSSVEDRIAELERAVAAQEAQRAALGDEVVDLTVRTLRARIAALRAGEESARPPRPDSGQLLRSIHDHIPRELADKMLAAGDLKGERRQVTVLFADLAGYTALSETLDPEEVAGLIHEVLGELARVVFAHEGYVDKFIGDAVMAVFGAPVAHEDDAERALRAALAMMERLKEFNRDNRSRLPHPLGLHAGVNTGPVVAGNVDASLRMPYSVIGDTVNTASRLEGAAETGQILVSQSTWRLTREAFVFRPLDPIRVKGKAQPLTVYELERARLSPAKSRGLRGLGSVFVGRDGEISRLRRVAAELARGRGGIVAVTGEAGIGKSRLMAEWRREIESTGSAVWLEGRCHASTAEVAYGPFLDLVRRHSGIDDEQTEETARRRLDLTVERFLPGDGTARAVAARLLAFPPTPREREILAAIPARELRERAFGLLETIFTALASEGPVTIVVEDLHWADATSLELLARLFRLTEGRPLAVACVSRPLAGGEPPLISAAREQHGERLAALSLSPLTEGGSVELVSGLLSMRELPASLRRLVVARGEGNPFFVEEMIRTLIEQGALARGDGGAWKPTELMDSATVPDTLHGLLMARLDALPHETRRLAQQAAVVGRIFLYRVLRRMAGAGGEIDEGLNRMEHDDLIRRRISDPELEYMFRHALTQEVAYGSLLAAERAGLHRQVGEAMEEVFAGRIGELTGVVGGHYLKGESWEKAAGYLMRAGDAAARLFANAEARGHFLGALAAIERLPDSLETRRQLVDATVRYSRASVFSLTPAEILPRLERAEQVAAALPGPDGAPGGDLRRIALVDHQTGHVHYSANRMREAVGYYRKVLAAAPALDDPELLGIPSFAIGNVLIFQGHMGKGRKLLGQAIGALEKTRNWFFCARGMAMHSFAMAHMGDCTAAEAEGLRALAKGREINSTVVIASANLMLGAAYSYAHPVGEGLERTLEVTRSARATAEAAGDLIMHYLSHGVLAWNLAMGGRFEEAADSMRACQELAGKMGEQVLLMDMFTARRADIALGLGRVEEAIELAGRAIAIAQKMGGIWAEGHARRTLGRALATLDPPRWDEAGEEMRRSLELYEEGQNLMGVAHTRIAWGEICRGRGDLDGAREHWARAAAFFEEKGLTKRVEEVRALAAAG